MNRNAIVFLTMLSVISFVFLYKLDYPYFFTDEILYIDSGREHLNGIYESSMQVPLINKYIAGFMYRIADHNVFLLRLPFAVMGILTSVLVYLILKKEFGFLWGILGMLLFGSSSIIFSASRMVMLEPLMHLSWLTFLYLYYLALKENRNKLFLLAGLALGLALSSKITSVILIPFALIFSPYLFKKHKIDLKSFTIKYLLMFGTGLGTFTLTYIHPFIKIGEKNTFRVIYESIISGYIIKSEVGKKHLINEELYTKSPYWTYAYYLYAKEGVIRIGTYIVGFISSFLERSLFVYYWLIFFIFSFGFYQFSGVKNARYISSFEIPLIVLVIAGFNFLSKKFSYVKYFAALLIVVLFASHFVYAVNQPRTEYNALFENYLKEKTNNFTSDDKIYIYGSMRSSRWYKHGKAEGMDMFDISSDPDENCPEFGKYDFLIIEKEELNRYGENYLNKHVEENSSMYDFTERDGFLIYKKSVEGMMSNVCGEK